MAVSAVLYTGISKYCEHSQYPAVNRAQILRVHELPYVFSLGNTLRRSHRYWDHLLQVPVLVLYTWYSRSSSVCSILQRAAAVRIVSSKYQGIQYTWYSSRAVIIASVGIVSVTFFYRVRPAGQVALAAERPACCSHYYGGP